MSDGSTQLSGRQMLTHARLVEMLAYDAETGMFARRKSVQGYHAHHPVGHKTARGYVIIRVDRVSYLAHRLAWFYVHGKWPVVLLDHRNGEKGDNRIANLREADYKINNQNKRGPTPKNNAILYLAYPNDGRALP